MMAAIIAGDLIAAMHIFIIIMILHLEPHLDIGHKVGGVDLKLIRDQRPVDVASFE